MRLHSLGCWEHEVRRRHDTLLQRYLGARGMSTDLSREVRQVYWLASACNTLAGALEYQLAVAMDSVGRSARERSTAICAARQHLRVIRHADSPQRV